MAPLVRTSFLALLFGQKVLLGGGIRQTVAAQHVVASGAGKLNVTASRTSATDQLLHHASDGSSNTEEVATAALHHSLHASHSRGIERQPKRSLDKSKSDGKNSILLELEAASGVFHQESKFFMYLKLTGALCQMPAPSSRQDISMFGRSNATTALLSST
eukprot:TRINITY_DN70891_c0_g1_i2.p1 TRINITY_DN70891_c0_g1~~TRINITY_DN70891_c0_g1_i2.p1  ORF type:complete len:160 (-),score=7.64 TRINITY_DN70891_c0_g1_i2:2-481(-)